MYSERGGAKLGKVPAGSPAVLSIQIPDCVREHTGARGIRKR